VADATGEMTGSATIIEAYVLLSAWLSPLPPPPVERLSDFN
jgi:hypothetical protein